MAQAEVRIKRHDLKIGRTILNLTQAQAAARLGVSTVHLCNIERGESMPGVALLRAMATLYGEQYVAPLAHEMFGSLYPLARNGKVET